MTTPRVLGGVFCLALIWIAVYWFYDPGKPGKITIESTPDGASLAGTAAGPATGTGVGTGAGLGSGTPVTIEAGVDAPLEGAGAPASPGGEGPRVVAPRFTTHVVAEGETWGDISSKYYGTRTHVAALVRANPIKSPTNLRAGDEILVPEDPANIQGAVVTGDGQGQAPVPDAPPEPAREYRVGKSETFGGISKALFGTTSRWEELYEFNRERLRLSKPEGLREGHVLLIPPDPDRSAQGEDGR